MRTNRLSIIVGAAVICCAFRFCLADSLTVATDSVAVTTPDQARRIALAYTGFDSTAKTDIAYKKFRLAVMPMTDSAGNEIIKESNLWLVTFYQLDAVVLGRFQDFKVFLDSASGYLVQLYSVPVDTSVKRVENKVLANETNVADKSRLHLSGPTPIPFIKAIEVAAIGIDRKKSPQVYANLVIGQEWIGNSLKKSPIWSLWGFSDVHKFGDGSLVGDSMLQKVEVNALTASPMGIECCYNAPYQAHR
ncbi:MAG: hypothetical protein WAU88_06405 [Candidatus Zixiibacteriota bacterium]